MSIYIAALMYTVLILAPALLALAVLLSRRASDRRRQREALRIQERLEAMTEKEIEK